MVTQNPAFAQHLELLSARATMLKLPYNEAQTQLKLAKSDLATRAAALDALFPFF